MKAYKCSLKIDDSIHMCENDFGYHHIKTTKSNGKYSIKQAQKVTLKLRDYQFRTLERCIIQYVDSEKEIYMSFLIIVNNQEYGEIEKEVKETIIRKENIDLIRKKISLL